MARAPVAGRQKPARRRASICTMARADDKMDIALLLYVLARMTTKSCRMASACGVGLQASSSRPDDRTAAGAACRRVAVG
jgi:hypothetical protein